MNTKIIILVYTLAGWIIASGIVRLFIAKTKSVKHISFRERIYNSLPVIISDMSMIILAAALLNGIGLLFIGKLLTALLALAYTMIFSATLDLFAALTYYSGNKHKIIRMISSFLSAAIALSCLIFVFYLRSIPGSSADAVKLSYPVKGEWRIVTGGRSRLTNYHHGNPDTQNLAVDMISANGDSDGADIYSPADGIVTEAICDRDSGSAEPEGNLIKIKISSGAEIWLAHLKQNSVIVKTGDKVTKGDVIAKCGASGSAEIAHLHIHAEKDGKPVVMLFGHKEFFLIKNCIIKN